MLAVQQGRRLRLLRARRPLPRCQQAPPLSQQVALTGCGPGSAVRASGCDR
jgi:hypothetical protein